MKKTIRLQGTPAAPGIAIAPAQAIDRQKILIPKEQIESHQVDEEIARMQIAVGDARDQIEASIHALTTNDPKNKKTQNHAMILQTHLLLLSDILLIDATMDFIRHRQINAEWALAKVQEDLVEQFSSADNEYIAERAEDIVFVSNRLLRNLLGHDDDFFADLRHLSDCIIVTIDLSPAETAQMISSPILGFATEKGTQTSHTAIMGQALGIPAVVGIEKLTEHVSQGDTLIIDGSEGLLIINPDEETITRYEERKNQWVAMENRLRSTRNDPSITTDGVSIALKGNIELPAEAPFALDFGAQGIGLYRTEFLYLDKIDVPTRDEQVRTYASVIKAVAPNEVIFRTFDMGADKMPKCVQMSRARNPALGMRAIRIGLRKHPILLKDQVKAIVLAGKNARQKNVWIMFPLVSGIGEFRQLKALVMDCLRELEAEYTDTALPHPVIGCMIELPSAVFISDMLALEADFFSIGTNDLIQYMMAIDRVNDDVAYLYTPYHPSTLRAIKMVVDAADKAGIPVSICGGAAGEPMLTPLLLGLGLRQLSMAPHAIPLVKAAIRELSAEEAKDLTAHALTLPTADEVEQLVTRFMHGKLDLKY